LGVLIDPEDTDDGEDRLPLGEREGRGTDTAERALLLWGVVCLAARPDDIAVAEDMRGPASRTSQRFTELNAPVSRPHTCVSSDDIIKETCSWPIEARIKMQTSTMTRVSVTNSLVVYQCHSHDTNTRDLSASNTRRSSFKRPCTDQPAHHIVEAIQA